jgi:hypothetical protein
VGNIEVDNQPARAVRKDAKRRQKNAPEIETCVSLEGHKDKRQKFDGIAQRQGSTYLDGIVSISTSIYSPIEALEIEAYNYQHGLSAVLGSRLIAFGTLDATRLRQHGAAG